MANNWRFILQPGTSDELEMQEPAGWNDIEIVLKRDPVYHGISAAFSNKSLELDGDAAQYVKEQFEQFKYDAQVVLRLILECEEGTTEYSEDFSLDFNTYEEDCGVACGVSIGFTENGCFTQFRNNIDKKVDLDNQTAFDETTALTQYPFLRRETILPTIPLFVSTEGNVADEGDNFGIDYPAGNIAKYSVRPLFGNVRYEAINLSQLSNPSVIFGVEDEVVSPLVLFDEIPACFSGEFDVQLRVKGSIQVSDTGSGVNKQLDLLQVYFFQTEGSYFDVGATILATQNLATAIPLTGTPQNFDFDLSFSDPTHNIAIGENIYVVIVGQHSIVGSTHPVISVQWEPETYAKIETVKTCPETANNLYLTFETLSRVIEATSDKCLLLDSEYYGRTDSAPQAYDEDGCGALRAFTSGLYLRNAENPKFFASFKDLIDGLRCIDNIGFGLLKYGYGIELVKVEPVEFFYSDQELLRLDNVSKVKSKVAANEIIGIIKSGYEKWEPESINGLDEFNSTREYRMELKVGRNTFDITCKLIAGSYIIELTRQQNFAATGAADTKFDNDTFIICLMRDAYNSMLVETGVISDPANILFPDNVYNFRIRPTANMLRWFKWFAGMYPDHTTKKIIFSEGKGNIRAMGWIEDDCALEDAPTTENQNIEAANFKEAEQAMPLIRPEPVNFEYPLSLADFLELRANPYGFISYQCGTGEWLKGYIFNLSWRPANGMATFELRKKYA